MIFKVKLYEQFHVRASLSASDMEMLRGASLKIPFLDIVLLFYFHY